MSKTGRGRLSGVEKFGVVSGMIGLVADAIALITFVTGFVSLDTGPTAASGTTLFLIVTALLLLYGWFTLAWVLTKRGLGNIAKGQRWAALDDCSIRATVGVGLLIAPLALVWLVALSSVSSMEDFWSAVGVIGLFPVALLIFGVCLSIKFLMPLVYEDLADTRPEEPISE